MTKQGERHWIDVRAVAAIVGVHPNSIPRMVRRGTFPPPTKVGAATRWERGLIHAWLEAGGSKPAVVSPGAEAQP